MIRTEVIEKEEVTTSQRHRLDIAYDAIMAAGGRDAGIKGFPRHRKTTGTDRITIAIKPNM